MARFLAVLAIAASLLVPAVAQANTGDSVVGSGIAGDFAFDVNATNTGANPTDATGTATITFASFPSVGVAGPVTCLSVSGNTAVVTFAGTGFGGIPSGDYTARLVDNAGFGPDTFTFISGVNNCGAVSAADQNVTTGDIVVHDEPVVEPPPATPTTKEQCKNQGYKTFGFDNQGQCVSFVNHHS
jgi:hypothetical protein